MNLLIVDDDKFIIEGIMQGISWEEFSFEHIYTAVGYYPAKRKFVENRIDLVLCDIEMPQGSGLDLVEWARTEGFKGEVIFLTSYAEFKYAQRAITLGCREYLLKPIAMDELTEVLRQAVKRREEALRMNGANRERADADQAGNALPDDGGAYARNSGSHGNLIDQIVSYIDLHLQENISRETLAKEFYLSQDYLSKIFKKTMGESIVAYITRKRMEAAKELLQKTGLPIYVVAERCGFTNCSYFAKIFKEFYGETPAEYRQRLGDAGS